MLAGCPTPAPIHAPNGGWANVAPAQVTEVFRADGRVYLRVVEGKWDFWVATGPLAVQVGDHVLMGKGPERLRFLSPELGRRFDVMTFIDDIATVSLEQSWAAVRLPLPEGGHPIHEVFANRSALAGQTIQVRGRVVKANKGIFDTNWYHLMDGTGAPGEDDLTVVSVSDAKVGDVVLASGTLSVDRDFGYGYTYTAILENSTLVTESSTP